jgi:hypothetical protein
MVWLTAIAFVGVLSIFVAEHAERLSRDRRSIFRKWYAAWAVKGLIVPAAVWILFNLGVLDRLPSLMLEVERASGGPARIQATIAAAGLGVFAIATYWAALTSAWLLCAFYRESDKQSEMKHHFLMWSIFLLPISLLVVATGGWYWAGLAGAIWLIPLLLVGKALVFEPVGSKPVYSRAVARMQFDKYEEAESAVIDELEKCEEDFDGWMLLAELYAVHFHDLPEAERTIRETCAHPATTDSQRAVALQKLADWHLKLANDAVAARRDLQEICQMAPGTHLAHMAQVRLDQLPASNEEWLQLQKGKTYRLPALRSDFDSAEPPAILTATPDDIFQARRLSEKLTQNPNDPADREELARVLTEKLGKVDAGLDQLRLLLMLPNQPDQKLAEWLALSASWQLKFKRDEAAARKVLEQLARRFPQSAQAFAAQRRLNLMDLETKVRARRTAATPEKIGLPT